MNRRDFLKTGTFAAVGAAAECAAAAQTDGAKDALTGGSVFRTYFADVEKLRFWVPSMHAGPKFMVVGDTHITLDDKRGEPYVQYSKRMGGGTVMDAGAHAPLKLLIDEAKREKVDLLALVGDIVSFPSEAGIEYCLNELTESGLNWRYISGNHDWHYEGVPGSDMAQRREWTARRLMPFFPNGQNPLCHSIVVKGVRFVFIDDSTYEILPEQLEFYRSEAAKGEPVALMMHIALWLRGGSVTSFGCAHPDWGVKTDPFWEIERRERWPQGHSLTTFAFRRAVVETPNLLGVFCGHTHRYQHGQDGNLLQFITPSGADGRRLLCSVNL